MDQFSKVAEIEEFYGSYFLGQILVYADSIY